MKRVLVFLFLIFSVTLIFCEESVYYIETIKIYKVRSAMDLKLLYGGAPIDNTIIAFIEKEFLNYDIYLSIKNESENIGSFDFNKDTLAAHLSINGQEIFGYLGGVSKYFELNSVTLAEEKESVEDFSKEIAHMIFQLVFGGS